MSLAVLFYLKETFRERMRRWRRASFVKRQSADGWHSALSPRHSVLNAERFTLESLEPRLLLSATPTEVIVPQEIALSKSSPVTVNEVNVAAPIAVDDAYTVSQDSTLNTAFNLVKDIVEGSGNSNPYNLTNVNGTLFFGVNNDSINGAELWKSDGTAAGTVLVKDIVAGSGGSNPYGLTNVNGTLFFTADDGITGQELWKSDGTAAGTGLVKEIVAGSDGSNPGYLTNVNGTLFFTAFDGINGQELWKSDGTAAGTVLVKDLYAGSEGSNPSSLTNVNGVLFFAAEDGINGRELWTSDGTAAGTVLVKDIVPGNGSSISFLPFSMASVDRSLFFVADDGTNGVELWKSDGTAAGTVLVKDIWAGSDSSTPSYLTDVNGKLFFAAEDGITGRELWTSDGTAAGTQLVADIYSGGSSSYPSNLTSVNGTLFLMAEEGITGRELWRSDGTAAGTVLVADINAGSGSAYPYNLTNVNGTLFFAANDGVHGFELWKRGGVLDNDSDPDSSTLTAQLVSGPAQGTLTLNPDGTFVYTPTTGFAGTETFTYQASDGVHLSNIATVTITVAGELNTAPVLDPIGNKTVDEGSLLTFTATASDGDVGQTRTFSLTDGPNGSVPTGASIDPSTGLFTWTPTEAQGPGLYTFDVVVTDNGSPALSDSETIQITVNEVSVEPLTLDVDGNGFADALTDGIVIIRHLFGFTGDALINGVVDPNGTRNTAPLIEEYLRRAEPVMLDVDGNGQADALSDGILIIRYLFGFTGDVLINGAVDPTGTRNTAGAIEAFLAGFLPSSTAALRSSGNSPLDIEHSTSASSATSTSTSASTFSAVVADSDDSTMNLSLAHVQRSWVQDFVDDGASLEEEDDELLIALPG